MITKVLQINNHSLLVASRLINKGELVAFPTETVYGLAANALNATAIGKIYEAKGRPSDNPLIVHISSKEMVEKIACDISDDAYRVMRAFFPGSLTVVLKKRDCVPSCVTAGMDTVAVRMPSSIEALEFIRACGVPIAAPSANTSTRPSPTRAIDVYNDLAGKIPLILKGDDCKIGIESTVLDMTRDVPTILRPGIVTPSQISAVLNKAVVYVNSNDMSVNSPGVRYKHYAPNCPMVLVKECNVEKIINYYKELRQEGRKPVILCQQKYFDTFEKCDVIYLGSKDEDVARNIFSTLRDCEVDFNHIICVYDGSSEIAISVLNRITKAAGGIII